MSQSTSLGIHPAMESALVVTGASAGSVYAVVTNNNVAAVTTIVATVGTMLYQLLRLYLENRKKAYQAESEAKVKEAERLVRESRNEIEKLKDRISQAEAEKISFKNWVDRLIASDSHRREDDSFVERAILVAEEQKRQKERQGGTRSDPGTDLPGTDS